MVKCQQKDCNEEASMQGELEQEIYNFCFNHAKEFGFCSGCGGFFAGTEEWDFPFDYKRIDGYCRDCSDDIRSDCGEFDEKEVR